MFCGGPICLCTTWYTWGTGWGCPGGSWPSRPSPLSSTPCSTLWSWLYSQLRVTSISNTIPKKRLNLRLIKKGKLAKNLTISFFIILLYSAQLWFVFFQWKCSWSCDTCLYYSRPQRWPLFLYYMYSACFSYHFFRFFIFFLDYKLYKTLYLCTLIKVKI